MTPSTATSLPAPRFQVVDFLQTDPRTDLQRSLVQFLHGPSRGFSRNELPGWLIGDRQHGLDPFLDSAIEAFGLEERPATLAIFVPVPADRPLMALADALEQVFPALRRCQLCTIPCRSWAAIVKAHLAALSDSEHFTLIVDQVESLFRAVLPEQEKQDFFRILCELAESPFATVLFVVDENQLDACAEVPVLRPSLESSRHRFQIQEIAVLSDAYEQAWRNRAVPELHRPAKPTDVWRLEVESRQPAPWLIGLSCFVAFALSVVTVTQSGKVSEFVQGMTNELEWPPEAGEEVHPPMNLTPVTGRSADSFFDSEQRPVDTQVRTDDPAA